MDPITLGLGVVGLGMSFFGSSAAAGKARQIAEISDQISNDEQSINEQKRQQMYLESRRMQLENIRNAQRQRAMATAAAVNQGAQMGSGLQGGYGQIYGQMGTNEVSNLQNLEIGENIFGFNNSISRKKAQIAGLQGQMASDQGMANFGKQLMGSAQTIGNIGSTFTKGFGSIGDPFAGYGGSSRWSIG